MNNPRFRFRAWDIEKRIMYDPRCVDLLVHFDGKIQGINANGYLIGTHNMPKMKLMQFTGLTDKNRKEIFEGDVIVWFVNDITRTGIVEYVTESCCYDLKNFHDEYHICNDWYRGEYEVIGNIYQDSHLLEASQ